MPTVNVNGIQTAYEVRGSGPPLLMMAPGGFDSTIENGMSVDTRPSLMDEPSVGLMREPCLPSSPRPAR